MQKSQANYMLVDPPTCEDLQTMALMEIELDSTSGVFQNMSEDKIKHTIKERVDIVGPILREVFVSQYVFNAYKARLDEDVSNIFSDLGKVSITDMPSGAKDYLGAFVVPGTFIPSLSCKTPDQPEDWYSVRFLSDYIVKLVARSCSKKNKLKLVEEKFDYLIAEAIMCCGLMTPELSKFMDDAWLYRNWVYYRNIGPAAKLGKKDVVANPVFPLYDKVQYFASICLQCDVALIEPKTLYKCSLFHGALYDAMLVCHPTETERGVVYAFQSIISRANRQHSLDYSAVKSVMNHLCFNVHDRYDLCYVCCSDASSKSETGCRLINDKNLTAKETKFIDDRLTILIARVCYYPKLYQW